MSNPVHLHARRGDHSPTHNSWRSMKGRCDDKSNASYPNYGGRGITYDPAWKDFLTFLADMGERPVGSALERKDNNANYNRENCCWASRSVQQHNRRILKNNTSGVTGVSWNAAKNVWVARAKFGGRRQTLLISDSFEKACAARKKWEEENVKRT